MQVTYRKYWTIILLVMIFVLGSIGSAQEQTTVTLSFPNVGVGQSAVVEAEIECAVVGCSAFAVTVTFDPAVIQVDLAEVGPFLGDRVFEADNVIDNEAGTVQLAAVALGDPPETDETVLFFLHVTGLTPGATVLQITELEVGDLMGNPLEAVGIPSAVVVTAEAVEVPVEEVPEETPEVTPESTPETEPDPCWVRNDDPEAEIAIRVGPGFHRPSRAWFPLEEDVLVVGQYEDDDGNIWWRIQPEGYIEAEGDRYWVAEEEVDEIGDCEEVMEVPASGYVRVTTPVSTTEPGSTPVVGIGEGAVYVPVYACIDVGNNVFQWYEANVVYDANGDVVEEEIIAGPFQGQWRTGCPNSTCVWEYVHNCDFNFEAGICELWQNSCTGQRELRACTGNMNPSLPHCPAGLKWG